MRPRIRRGFPSIMSSAPMFSKYTCKRRSRSHFRVECQSWCTNNTKFWVAPVSQDISVYLKHIGKNVTWTSWSLERHGHLNVMVTWTSWSLERQGHLNVKVTWMSRSLECQGHSNLYWDNEIQDRVVRHRMKSRMLSMMTSAPMLLKHKNHEVKVTLIE